MVTTFRRSPFALGLAVTSAVVLAGVLIAFRAQITVALQPSETVTVHFAENYGLRTYATDVKIAGVTVGDVTDVAPAKDGVTVTAEIDGAAYDKLRSRPSARVRPNTLLGGRYYLELVPGGQPGQFTGNIPQERTTLPVELDKITRALQPDVLAGLQGTVKNLDGALGDDTRSALQRLLEDAPDTLRPGSRVLAAARGNHPATDLPQAVRGLNRAAAALTEQQGRLDAILADLATTSEVLGNRSADVRQAIDSLPSTLDSTKTGLARLDTTLTKLKRTADPARPVARELAATLTELEPVLRKARPLVAKLDDALTDVQPLVEDLVPTAQGTTRVLDDISGPVLKRINGPVLDTLRSPWHGKGAYAGDGGSFPMYEAVAYALSGIAGGTALLDPNGNQFDISLTVGPAEITGLPVNLERFFARLMGLTERGAN